MPEGDDATRTARWKYSTQHRRRIPLRKSCSCGDCNVLMRRAIFSPRMRRCSGLRKICKTLRQATHRRTLPGAWTFYSRFRRVLQRSPSDLPTSHPIEPRYGRARDRPDAMGIDPVLGKGRQGGLQHDQCQSGDDSDGPAFREAFKSRRCLVSADAFYEWQKIDAKTKQPFAIGMKDRSPYAFAGLWDRWRDPATKEPLETFTVITTDPNEVVEPLHNRMPVILPERDYDRWLTPGDPARAPWTCCGRSPQSR
jgi:SOS response associated peptidase (SRAP)